jgi:hypothetical protein
MKMMAASDSGVPIHVGGVAADLERVLGDLDGRLSQVPTAPAP